MRGAEDGDVEPFNYMHIMEKIYYTAPESTTLDLSPESAFLTASGLPGLPAPGFGNGGEIDF